MGDGGDAHVDQRDLANRPGLDVQHLRAVRDDVGVDALGGEQAGRRAGDGGLPHLGEGVVGAGRQGQARDVPAGRRGRTDGAVATKRDDHAGAAGAHRPDERPGVVGGAGERVQLDELEVGQTARARPALRQCPHDAACDAHAVGGDQGPLDPGGPRGGEQPHHHVGLLGVGEHRGLRDEAADVAARHRVGDDPDGRARYHRKLPARDRAHRRSPSRGGDRDEGCSGVAAAGPARVGGSVLRVTTGIPAP